MPVDLPETPPRSRRPADKPEGPTLPSPEIIRARRQLIGLVVLVVLAVFGLPLVIQTDPQAISEDVVVEVVRSKTASDSATQDVQLDAAPQEMVATADPVSPPAVASASINKATPAKTANPNKTEKAIAKTTSAPNNAGKGESYFVQLGVFESLSKANNLRDNALKNGVKAQVQSVSISGQTQHAVRVLGLESRLAAEKIRSQLKKIGLTSILVKN